MFRNILGISLKTKCFKVACDVQSCGAAASSFTNSYLNSDILLIAIWAFPNAVFSILICFVKVLGMAILEYFFSQWLNVFMY